MKKAIHDIFERSSLLIGEQALERLNNTKVAVFGVGGVGGYVVEALARSGVGAFILVDNDLVSMSNINRQIIATVDTVGRPKTEVMKERILSINPYAQVTIYDMFYLPDNADMIDLSVCDYVVDAVDTITAKIEIIMRSQAAGVQVISSMGAGNKLDPTKFRVVDIYDTTICPLARVMRRELRKRGVESLKVVYSTEESKDIAVDVAEDDTGRKGKKTRIPGSIAYVPSVAGLIIASEVIRDIIGSVIE